MGVFFPILLVVVSLRVPVSDRYSSGRGLVFFFFSDVVV